MDHKLKAEELFRSGYNCAQSVFGAFSDVMDIDLETAVKVSSSFGGGMGKLREVCGACTGAFAVAGMLWGYTDPKDHAAKTEHYALIKRISEDFKAKNGTYICRELLEGIKNINSAEPAHRTKEYYAVRPCCKFVCDAAEILDDIIKERGLRK